MLLAPAASMLLTCPALLLLSRALKSWLLLAVLAPELLSLPLIPVTSTVTSQGGYTKSRSTFCHCKNLVVLSEQLELTSQP